MDRGLSLDEQLRERARARRLSEERRAERAAREEQAAGLRAAEAARKQRAERLRRSGDATPGTGRDFVLPLSGGTVTAGFGQRGDLWSTGSHTGMDLAAPAGTPIRAVADGTITAVSSEGPLGNHTVLTLADGTEVRFSHQQYVSVERGDRVEAGEEIGAVGATGNTTGPHLHLEVQEQDGPAIDPAEWLADLGLKL
ncbi:M23 family metallopeptidase [Streptomyces cyaneofuscatus]|uniref:M23 family metallopeptidase n=1 Tax=Streptomyces cyaneofuscatus TaxID=66883 RepID=UPI0033B21517